MKIDKSNGPVSFCEEEHAYWLNGNENDKCISVTTLIGMFHEHFDEQFWSRYKALEALLSKEAFYLEKKKLLMTKRFDDEILSRYDIDKLIFNTKVNEILDKYELEKQKACEHGTKFHLQKEQALYDGKPHTVEKFGVGGEFYCKQNSYELDVERGLFPEYLIYRESPDKILKIAGQIDLMIKDGNDITLIDYKGLPLDTKIPTHDGWKTMEELKEGDYVFDKNGKQTKVIHKSSVHTNPCYKIIFDNNDSIIADEEHRWEITFYKNRKISNVVMTTKEIFEYVNMSDKNRSYAIPKIYNHKGLDLDDKYLLIDPYVLGVWLGDGSKDCGLITESVDSPIWQEIEKRGYTIGNNCQHLDNRKNTSMRTIYGLRNSLLKLNLINNKHIPYCYQRSSFKQRLDLLRGFMDADGYYNKCRNRYVMTTTKKWQKDSFVELLSTFGIKSTVIKAKKYCNGKESEGWDICFFTNLFNPFLTRNQDVDINSKKKNSFGFRNIKDVVVMPIVKTQCIEVDSDTHTYLCTENMIVTHNTNKKIDQTGFVDYNTKKQKMMYYPLNNLPDCNFSHYSLQLSTYAWMIQQLNPKYKIKGLYIYHHAHDGSETIYDVKYLKDDVIRMLSYYKKKHKMELEKDKNKSLEF